MTSSGNKTHSKTTKEWVSVPPATHRVGTNSFGEENFFSFSNTNIQLSPSPRWKPLKNPTFFVSRDFGREKGISSRRSHSLTHSKITLPFILQMFWSSIHSLILLVNRWRLPNFFSFHVSYSKFKYSKLLFHYTYNTVLVNISSCPF